MKTKNIVTLIISIVCFFDSFSQTKKELELNGKLINVDTKSVYLVQLGQDTRFDNILEIPVVNGKFQYKASIENTIVVELCLPESVKNGAYRVLPVFLENEKINLTIYPENEFDNNIVEGGYLNQKYKTYKNESKLLFNSKEYLQLLEWEQKTYIPNNPNIISYYLFLNQLIYFKENTKVDLLKKNYEILSKANPNHQYNKLAKNLIQSIEQIKVGNKYIDFSAPDLNGNNIKLSSLIEGKITILDLWATWCSPCISKSRKLIPIFNEYKDKGLTIIGVAGEFKNTERLNQVLKKEKWDWINLIELDRKNSIWELYGVDNGGGGIFLINEKGIIISINPTIEEIEEYLKNNLTQN